MRLINLLEDEKADRILRTMSVAAFDKLLYRVKIEALNNYENFRRIEDGPFAGGFMFSGTHADLKSEGISAVIFLPSKKYDFRASLGHYRQSKDTVLFFACLLEPFSFRHFTTRLEGFKKDFVHEWAHHLLNDQYNVGSLDQGMDDLSNLKPEKYYNHAHETQAYYQEAAHETESFFRVVAQHAPHRLSEFSEMATPELVAFVRDRFVNQSFLRFLSQKNRQALDKRLARLIDQTIRPLIFEPTS